MVDPLMAAHIGDLILKLKQKFRKTSIVVTHDTFGRKLADTVVFLQNGKDYLLRSVEGFRSLDRPIPSHFPRTRRAHSRAGRNFVSQPAPADPINQLRRVMGFWDVLLFNIATVLGPRRSPPPHIMGNPSISL